MKLELTDLNKGSVLIGDKLVLKSRFLFDEDTSILWSGVRLFTNPPCGKEVQIAKKEIFTLGTFEAGEYIRNKAMLIKNNVVPTINKRDLGYHVQLLLRQKNPINKDDDLIIKRTNDIKILAKDEPRTQQESNPISFSISGLNINLKKDVFRPGETIKINYTSQNLKELEVRLLQKANLVCYCEPYGKNCRNVEELPPAIAGDAKTHNTEEGYLLVKVPEVAEPTHNYLWEPSEKEHWGMKYGDYTEWNLAIIGRKRPEFGREPVKFELPLTIVSKPITEKPKDIDLFAKGVTGGMNVFEEVSSKFQKRFQLVSIDSEQGGDELNTYTLRLKNISQKGLEGVTVKLSGLQEGLFETSPQLLGFKQWKKEEEKELTYESLKNISAIISIIEDNSQKSVRIQTPISF